MWSLYKAVLFAHLFPLFVQTIKSLHCIIPGNNSKIPQHYRFTSPTQYDLTNDALDCYRPICYTSSPHLIHGYNYDIYARHAAPVAYDSRTLYARYAYPDADAYADAEAEAEADAEYNLYARSPHDSSSYGLEVRSAADAEYQYDLYARELIVRGNTISKTINAKKIKEVKEQIEQKKR
ncbi:hypothetical protein MMC13_003011 [Lambiella insularis]|nr:hypothetical protein [Lambiella insularis]